MKSIMKTIHTACLRFAALSLLVLALVLPGCKYEDGPVVSFRSKRARIEGAKRIVKYTENGVDKTADVNACYQNSQYYVQYGFSIQYSSSDQYFDMYCGDYCGGGILSFVSESSKNDMQLVMPGWGGFCKPTNLDGFWEITKLTDKALHLHRSSGFGDQVIWLE